MPLLCLLLISISLFAQSPLQVDTSVKDIKPKPKVSSFPSKSEGYKPTIPLKANMQPFKNAESEFEREQQDKMDASARNTTPGF